MEHANGTMTCNGCESQEFSTLEYAGEHFYQCFHCEAIDDYRYEAELPEPPAVVWEPELVAVRRRPAAAALHPIHPVFADILNNFAKGAR